MLLRPTPSGYSVELQHGPHVSFQRPSVDVMFASIAQVAGPRGIGVLLTGMGTDGAQGLLAMRRAGAKTIAQDESSCVVYGMPREAKRLDAACIVTPLNEIPGILLRALKPDQPSHGDARAGPLSPSYPA